MMVAPLLAGAVRIGSRLGRFDLITDLLGGGSGGGSGGRLHIEGLAELRRSLNKIDKGLTKELGQVHKSVGQLVIDRLGGASTGVGQGRGETIRPSAAAREVQLLVGGSHRGGERAKQWGRVQKWPGGEAPHRPNIIQAAVDIQTKIEEEYMDGIEQVVRRAGQDFDRG